MLGAGFFSALYYSVYWRYRALFNDQGRYFDPVEMVVYDDSGFIFAIPALVLGGLAGWLARQWWKAGLK